MSATSQTAREHETAYVSGVVTDIDKRQEGGGQGGPIQVWNFTVEMVDGGNEVARIPVELTGRRLHGTLRNGDRVRLDLSGHNPGDVLQVESVCRDTGEVLVTSDYGGFRRWWRRAHRSTRATAVALLILAPMGALAPMGGVFLWRRVHPTPPVKPPASWCTILKGQWDDRAGVHLDDPGLRATLKEECGIDVQPPASQAGSADVQPASSQTKEAHVAVDHHARPPSAWCQALLQQWQFSKNNFNTDDGSIRAQLHTSCGIDL